MEKICHPVSSRQPVKGTGKELFLDTKGTCFLCLSASSSVTSGMTEVNLRSICRYLKINPSFIVLESLKGGFLSREEESGVSSENVNCDFTVMVCDTCANLISSLTDLIRQMEMIKILAAYQLQVFYQVIKAPELEKESQFLWKRFQEKMMRAEVDPVEARLVETLRHEAKESCSKKLKALMETSVPKVMVTPLTPERNLSPRRNQRCSALNKNQERRNDILKTRTSIMIPPPQRHLPLEHFMDTDGPSKSSDILHFGKTCNKYIHSEDNGNYFMCTVCGLQFPPNYKTVRGHLLKAHPEVFFIRKTPHHLINDKSKARCQLLLQTLKKQARRLVKGSSKNKITVYSCQFCNRKSVDSSTFKCHLLMEHYNILEDKLSRDVPKGISSTGPSTFTSKSDSFPRNKVGGVQWVCTVASGGCGRTFALKWNLTRHKNEYCPNRKLKRFWTCNTTGGGGGCGGTFTSYHGFLRHKRESCLGSRERRVWTCLKEGGGCGRKFWYKHSLRRHLEGSCSKICVDENYGIF